MIDWVGMGRKTLDMLCCETWEDIAARYGLYRDVEAKEAER